MKILFVIFSLLTSSFAYAAQTITGSLSNKINAFLTTDGGSATIGIEVLDPATGKILYSKNADHYFMPASNEKLFTASAALSSLSQNFSYKTNLFVDVNKIQNGILNDNIYLQFSGDPTLTVAQLEQLVQALSQAGIHQLNGNIIVDDTAFDQMGMSPGSTWDDKDYCWGSPTHAITIEQNCVKATLAPAANPNQPANLILPVYPQSLQFINNAVTGASDAAECKTHVTRSGTNDYTITGCISAKSNAIEMAIDNPRSNLQFLLNYLLTKNQISSLNQYKYEKIINPPKLLATVYSPLLPNLITTMLKESDNGIAESLFKTMGALYAKDSGSFKNGSDAVRNIISSVTQVTIPNTTLLDGSGASRYNFLTPQQIVALLQNMYLSNFSSLFISALPIGGVDGTLKERMKDPTTAGKVHAKTGTMTAASTLSGYLETHNKHTLIFSIMVNGFVESPVRYQELQDKLCAIIIANA